jgi:drug/metabolite transporter superfamily protein YnfA
MLLTTLLTYGQKLALGLLFAAFFTIFLVVATLWEYFASVRDMRRRTRRYTNEPFRG